ANSAALRGSESIDTGITRVLLAARSFASERSCGSSLRHGPHQLAQKLSTTTWTRRDDSVSCDAAWPGACPTRCSACVASAAVALSGDGAGAAARAAGTPSATIRSTAADQV